MDLSQNQKFALMSILAGTAVLAVAAIYFMSKEPGKGQADIIDDVKILGEVRYTSKERKLLEKQYFVDLVALVRFHTAIEFKEEKAELVKQRQALYTENDKNR